MYARIMKDPEPHRSGLLRLPVIAACALFVAVCAMTVSVVFSSRPTLQSTPTAHEAVNRPEGTPTAADTRSPDRAKIEKGAELPAFDIVRVAPDGEAVLAGRAAPSAEVIVADGGREIGRTNSNEQGQWALVPADPLPSGVRALTLTSRTSTGPEVAGDAPVVVFVQNPAPPQPVPPALAAQAGALAKPPRSRDAGSVAEAMVVQTPLDGPARVIQGNAPAAPTDELSKTAQPSVARDHRLGLDIVDYDAAGDVRFAGSAPEGTKGRVNVDNTPAGEANSGPDGRWTIVANEPIAGGDHAVRIDQVAADGKIGARIELPFRRAENLPRELGEGRIIVQPGQSSGGSPGEAMEVASGTP